MLAETKWMYKNFQFIVGWLAICKGFYMVEGPAKSDVEQRNS